MNILLLNWRDSAHPKAGGAELVTMEHAKGWVRAGHTVTWLTGWYAGGKKEEDSDGVHILRRAGSLTIYLYATAYVLINARKFDVIVDEAHGFPFFSPLCTKTPVILFIHEIAGEIWDYMFPFPKNVVGKMLESWYFKIYRNCYVWTDASSTIDELVERGIPRKNCIAIPCPIVKKSLPKAGPPLVKKERSPTYLFVSRIVRMKGVEEVIKAFAFIYREEHTSKLWLVGGGEEAYIKELKTMISEYGIKDNVAWFGIVSEKEKYELMSRAHILLHASVKEGWGLVVLEAASVGTPAVVYNVSGLREVVKHNKTGIVLETNSPQEMAKKAMTLLKNKRLYAAYQQNGKIWVDSLHWDDAISKSLELLQKAT